MLSNKEIIKNKMVELEKDFISDNTKLQINCITDYSQGSIEDVYHKIADKHKEISTVKLFEMGYKLYVGGYIEIAIEGSRYTDITQILMLADSLRNEEILYTNDKSIRLYYALSILKNLEIEGLDIKKIINSIDLQVDRLEFIKDNIINILENYK